MKKLLLTGFEPFLDHADNPTRLLADTLDSEMIGEYVVKSVVLPVTFSEAAEVVVAKMKEHQPDAVMMLGLAAGRNRITPERVAINCSDGDTDNDGVRKQDEPIIKDGSAAYFSTLPIRKYVDILREAGIPAAISNTAGTYVCNNIMYQTLHYIEENQLNVPAGFVHVPASSQMAIVKPGLASMSEDEMLRAVRLMIEAM
ncbi:pyroglutamyl-peptidase I [Alkalihalophilus lindianensis]|uniref:Pyrrolidone-carboxylate peptidase n=1 Tax=Alkalihalophilus lindianensis TaxID=1630542 RepID=A0ABU3XAG8_9BACI|nr:pyroglutamyl-peptidase I [Alkalihalophilus lindianensis]MDV2684303.1 pyroglutamyl-peptidase I [Alkalihalophilus lindianensis]